MTISSHYVQIELTTICNFACFYCAGRDMPQRHMDMAVFDAIIDRLPPPGAHGVVTVSLQGEGEPTLHPRFWDMVDAVRAKGHDTYTITNGTRVDAGLFSAGLSSVGVSIDTADPQEAERIGRFNLPKVLANFEALLRAMGPDRVVVHTVHYGQAVAPLQAYLRQLGVRRHIVQPLQVKDDYARRYADQAQAVLRRLAPPPVTQFRCGFLDTPRMRFFDIEGREMPCCFIKDASIYTSIDDLRQQLAQRRVPPACAGCRELR
jgi:MoaA/NifB/PqqE/SkfB family radical SAM enzyme